ncbi:MAG TPA: SAM-dependent methyltransferase, partial [Ktedonobacteraceae bacterium]|nr:SAM-dependent methyltransferase [Ktedonobacteraceae bacterium]
MSESDLQQLIFEHIQRDGPITFAEYMRMALYEPEHGYYMTGAAKMGWEADYFTSTDVSNLFAHCMGRQLFAMWEKLKRPGNFIVLEQGAGRGHLAEGVQSWAQKEAPEFYRVLEYRAEDIRVGADAIEERSIVQGQFLRGRPSRSSHTNESPVSFDRVDESKPEYSRGDPRGRPVFPAVVLTNELIDAFPVHVVEKRGERLYEVFVDVLEDGRFCEVLDEPSTPEVAGYLDRYKIPWRTFEDGWRAEVNLDALRWIQRTVGLVRKGFILTIDYGDKARELYTAWRRRGTLLCYYKHHANERPLLHPGKQDITAHVNFSTLIDEGRRLGMRLHQFTTQREWLQG